QARHNLPGHAVGAKRVVQGCGRLLRVGVGFLQGHRELDVQAPLWRSSMSRPRLDAEQKKVSFSLAFSPHLIAALEKVRGAKSQSVFVEEWLRQHPQIAASLAAMNDPGFVPPVARYEQLMERLLAFYSPGLGEQPTIQ